MIENHEPISPTKINWELVHEKNKGVELNKLYEQTFSGFLAAWRIDEHINIFEANRDGLLLLGGILSEVVAECSEAGGIPRDSEIILIPSFNLTPGITACAMTKNGLNLIVINGNTLVSAAQELWNKWGTKGEMTLAPEIIFAIAHEMGHIRQHLVLGNDGGDVPRVGDKTDADNSFIAQMRYLIKINTHPTETNAHGFATRYVKSKQADPEATDFWKHLDFSGTLRDKWSTITDMSKIKSLIDLDELKRVMENASPEQQTRLGERLAGIRRKIETWTSRRDRMREILLGERKEVLKAE